MNSMNHYAFGSIVQWMYQTITGLMPDDSAPGFKKAVIAPKPDSRLSFAHCTYFTLRSGGKTIITFLFDCGYTWIISVPLALLMVKTLHADVLVAFAAVESANIIKCVLGYFFVRSGRWIQNLTTVTGNA